MHAVASVRISQLVTAFFVAQSTSRRPRVPEAKHILCIPQLFLHVHALKHVFQQRPPPFRCCVECT
jgi:hypothetical protein